MTNGPSDTEQTGPLRTRLGCLGCLGKLLLYLVGLLVLGSLLLLAIDAVFMPWSFFMGGRFHPIPMWGGWGKMHSTSGRDYVLSVWFEPYHRAGRRGVPFSSTGPEVRGWGTLCTPQGERYDVRVVGYLERQMGSSTDGKRMEMRVYRRPWYYGFVGRWEDRPRLDLYGAWHNPDLVLYDHGSLDRAFNPDATLRPPNSGVWKPGEQGVQLTLHEGSKSEFKAACRDIQGR